MFMGLTWESKGAMSLLTYLLTYSFPCTDLSVAGKMLGMSRKEWEEGKATRSGLLWEVERILKELPKEQLPDILLMENVPQVHAEKNREDFESWLTFLRNRGYHNFWQDMNATDYGVAQNRVRCFCVSVLSDDYVEYDFPEEIPLETVVEDYLESDVDSKFFITSEKAEKLIGSLIEKGVLPAIEQRAESREQRAENHADVQLICQYEIQKKNQRQTVLRQELTEGFLA